MIITSADIRRVNNTRSNILANLKAGQWAHSSDTKELILRDQIPGVSGLSSACTSESAFTFTSAITMEDTLTVNSKVGICTSAYEGTISLTINQGANDDIILSLKSSDVAHGVTTLLETDTFLGIKKNHSTGGANITCITGDAYGDVMTINVISPEEPIVGALNINASIIDGTGTTSLINGNLFCVSNNGVLKFNIEPEGDIEITTTDYTSSIVMYTAGGIGSAGVYKWNGKTKTFSFGNGFPGVDYSISIFGQSNSFSATWMDDEDYLVIHDNIIINGTTTLKNLAVTESLTCEKSLICSKETNVGVGGDTTPGVTIPTSGEFYCTIAPTTATNYVYTINDGTANGQIMMIRNIGTYTAYINNIDDLGATYIELPAKNQHIMRWSTAEDIWIVF